MSDAERPLRSVFIGNIPYEVTEEKLKEIFSEAGPVLSLKLVYDRETGKPKGYGFCEYKDIETASCAMRNLNGYEINGRILRVDNAGAERTRMAEMQSQSAQQQQQNQTHHQQQQQQQAPPPGNFTQMEEPIGPDRAPEAISRAVASLPPEQMFDLMKQMKLCIQNNPNEARTMLLQNPQLAYALLQAQVVMKIVEPQVALTMLHKDNQLPMGSLMPEGQSNFMMPQTENPWIAAGAGVPSSGPNFGQINAPAPSGDMDLRQLDPRLRNQPPPQDFDLRDPRNQGRGGGGGEGFALDPRSNRDRDMREMRGGGGGDPRTGERDRDMRDPRLFSSSGGSSASSAPSQDKPSDPRSRARAAAAAAASATDNGSSSKAPQLTAGFSGTSLGLSPSATDQEKAALIMQVLQLKDEQIAMFPPEQRQSILVLKEQISKSTSAGAGTQSNR